MTSKCYETSMTYYDETFGGETYFICLTIVLFPDSPAPVREKKSVLARWTHTQTFQIFPCSIKRVWGSDTKRSSICWAGRSHKSTSCQYQIERAKILFPLISPQVITGWGEDLINLNLERKKDCYWNYIVVLHPYYSHDENKWSKKTKGKRENWCHVKWPKTTKESMKP